MRPIMLALASILLWTATGWADSFSIQTISGGSVHPGVSGSVRLSGAVIAWGMGSGTGHGTNGTAILLEGYYQGLARQTSANSAGPAWLEYTEQMGRERFYAGGPAASWRIRAAGVRQPGREALALTVNLTSDERRLIP